MLLMLLIPNRPAAMRRAPNRLRPRKRPARQRRKSRHQSRLRSPLARRRPRPPLPRRGPLHCVLRSRPDHRCRLQWLRGEYRFPPGRLRLLLSPGRFFQALGNLCRQLPWKREPAAIRQRLRVQQRRLPDKFSAPELCPACRDQLVRCPGQLLLRPELWFLDLRWVAAPHCARPPNRTLPVSLQRAPWSLRART